MMLLVYVVRLTSDTYLRCKQGVLYWYFFSQKLQEDKILLCHVGREASTSIPGGTSRQPGHILFSQTKDFISQAQGLSGLSPQPPVKGSAPLLGPSCNVPVPPDTIGLSMTNRAHCMLKLILSYDSAGHPAFLELVSLLKLLLLCLLLSHATLSRP